MVFNLRCLQLCHRWFERNQSKYSIFARQKVCIYGYIRTYLNIQNYIVPESIYSLILYCMPYINSGLRSPYYDNSGLPLVPSSLNPFLRDHLFEISINNNDHLIQIELKGNIYKYASQGHLDDIRYCMCVHNAQPYLIPLDVQIPLTGWSYTEYCFIANKQSSIWLILAQFPDHNDCFEVYLKNFSKVQVIIKQRLLETKIVINGRKLNKKKFNHKTSYKWNNVKYPRLSNINKYLNLFVRIDKQYSCFRIKSFSFDNVLDFINDKSFNYV